MKVDIPKCIVRIGTVITVLSNRLSSSRLNGLSHLQSVVKPCSQGDVDVLDLYISCIKTDRDDQLFTTVVCDEHQRCLGLVYSNTTSVANAFLQRKGVYYSRSRSGLWYKGESSGMAQILLTMRLDCDRDALRFTVLQLGEPPAFCHQLTRSCWGEQNGLQKLQHTLQQRKLSAPEDSYTMKLFKDNGLLRQKLLEEVQELVEAEDKEHIAAEAADVMYFMMTR
jgi:phosphoribosyl-ATP pyrophosphohydrolase/phosphoribosyl-AMP cyclohydrolase/histidinol dehydrogenase